MAQVLQGISFGFFDDLPDSDKSHLDDILYGEKALAARPDLPWSPDEDPENLKTMGEDPNVVVRFPADLNIDAGAHIPTQSVIDPGASQEGDFSATVSQPPPPPGVHPSVYPYTAMPIAGMPPVYSYPVMYPQPGIPPPVAISDIPRVPAPSETIMPPPVVAAAMPDHKPGPTPPGAKECPPDNNNTVCGPPSDVNDKQTNKILGGKTYERRNKKKRPPNYYQNLTGSSTRQVDGSDNVSAPVTVVASSMHPPPQPRRPVVPPPVSAHVHYQPEPVLPPGAGGVHPVQAAAPPYLAHQSPTSQVNSSSPSSPPLAYHVIVPTPVPPHMFPPGMAAGVTLSPHFMPPGAPVQGPPQPQRLLYSSSAVMMPNNAPIPAIQSQNPAMAALQVNPPLTQVVAGGEQPVSDRDHPVSGCSPAHSRASLDDDTAAADISFGEVCDDMRNIAEEKNVFSTTEPRNNNNLKMSPQKRHPATSTTSGASNKDGAVIIDTVGASSHVSSHTVVSSSSNNKGVPDEFSRASAGQSFSRESSQSPSVVATQSQVDAQSPTTVSPQIVSQSKSQPSGSDSNTTTSVDSAVPSVSVSASTSVTTTSQSDSQAAPPPQLSPGVAKAAPKPKATSWAGLFHGTSTAEAATVIYNERSVTSTGDSAVPPTVSKENEGLPETIAVDEDEGAKLLGRLLKDYSLCYTPPSIQPRGLINRGNWCYVNATLQALLGCAPFYNLLKSLPGAYRSKKGPSSTPILDSIVEFSNEFSPMPPQARPLEKNSKGKGNVKYDITPGPVFEVQYIYKMLQVIKYDGFKSGRQEDAEEFLSCVLNGLHDEMTAAIKSLDGPVSKTNTPDTNEITSNGLADASSDDNPGDELVDDNGWEQVGPKNRAVLTRTANCESSPISEIFRGQFRNILSRLGAKESATLQPFFTLQLDIQSEKIFTVQDALENLVSRETLQGVTCAKTNVEVDASRRTMLEDLPPVLILHLKCFVYDKNGGCQKVIKQVDFSNELEINKDLLSPTVKVKYSQQQRKYKLFAVVKHVGVRAIGGHYTADVYYQSLQDWLHFDDNHVNSVSMPTVFKFRSPRIPYLLYYRRADQIS